MRPDHSSPSARLPRRQSLASGCWSRCPALARRLVDFVLASACPLLVELSKLGSLKSGKTKADGFQMSAVESEILTLEEVAAYLKAGKRTVYRLAQKGQIPAFKVGGTWRFRRSELNRWIVESINKNQPEAE